MEECRLIARIKKGDKEAFTEIYLKYSRILGFFLMGYVKSQPDVEEIIQDTFLKVWERREELNCKLSFKNYLFKLSKNAVLNKIRHKNVEEVYKLNYELTHSKVDSSTEESIIYSDYEQFCKEAINELPPKRKDIFLLSRYKGLTYDEIAKYMNISKKTVEKQISEALKYLKKKISIESDSILDLVIVLVSTLLVFG